MSCKFTRGHVLANEGGLLSEKQIGSGLFRAQAALLVADNLHCLLLSGVLFCCGETEGATAN